MSQETEQSVKDLLMDLDKLSTPEEKEAYLQKHLSKTNEKTPQVIGVSEHAGTDGVPCL